MRPYTIYDVGILHPCWEVEDCPGSIAYSTRENYVFRGPADVEDLVATIEKGPKHHWNITMLESGTIITLKIVDVHMFEFEYMNTHYVWKRREEKIWNLTDTDNVLLAQFDEVKNSFTKLGKLYITGKGKWLEHEIIVATIKAAVMYISARIC
jgi:hypothetical protein